MTMSDTKISRRAAADLATTDGMTATELLTGLVILLIATIAVIANLLGVSYANLAAAFFALLGFWLLVPGLHDFVVKYRLYRYVYSPGHDPSY